MNGSEHSNYSLLYKSKSVNNSNRDDERKQNRADRRFTAFQKNRRIEPTPRKPTEMAEITPDEGIGSFSAADIGEATATAPASNVDRPQMSRQKAFRDRFNRLQEYLKNKEQTKSKANSKPKPFVSAAPKGRFIDVAKPDKTVAKKKVPVKPVSNAQIAIKNVMPICDTPHHRSPINTRSKKLKLIPMMDVIKLTPNNKKRKPIEVKKAQTSGVNANNARSVTNIQRMPIKNVAKAKVLNTLAEKTTSGAIKKVLKPAQPSKITQKKNEMIKPTLTAPKTTTITNKVGAKRSNAELKVLQPKPSTSKQADDRNKKPIPASQFTKSPKIPKNFDFGPSGFNGIIASTAVKPKKQTVPSSRVSKNIFNESISPIETSENKEHLDDKTLSSKRRSKLMKTPKVIRNAQAPFISPHVKIVRKMNQNDRTLTPKNKSIAKELNVTAEQAVTPIQTANKSPVNYVSPFVTISRGRISSHKEAEARQSKYKLDSRKSLDLNESVDRRQNKEAAAYFRLQVDSEVKRFNELSEKWTKYRDENEGTDSLPSSHVDSINVTIGQTNLLLGSKFKQFCVLVDQCEDANVSPPVKPEDLEGFWSMVYLQVERLLQRYENLETLKNNNWQDPAVEVVKKKKIRPGSGVAKTKPSAKRPVNRELAKMLMAARKNYNETKDAQSALSDSNGVMLITKRKSILADSLLNHSKIRQTLTPSKTPWTVTDAAVDLARTPAKSILKTPGSVRRQQRTTLTFKTSPLVKWFNKENDSTVDDK